MARPKKQSIQSNEAASSTAPSVRIFTAWTPQMLKTAERQAESGSLSYAVTLCEWLLTDDRVSGALSARTDAMIGMEPTFELGTGRRAKQAQKALEADEDWWESYPESETAQLLTWGILLGAAPARHRWEERDDHGGRLLPKPRFWHPQTLRWDWHLRKWFVRDDKNVELEVVPGDGEWILHTPYGDQRPWAYGLWRSLARWVLLKQYAITDWARHSEKGSVLVATAPEGATEKQRKALAEDLANAGEDTVVSLAAGFDMKLVEVSANTKAIYEAQIQMADLAIAIRIRGGNLSTNVEGGSHAAAESQKETGDDAKLKFDATSIATTYHDQSLTWWAEFNFGDKRLAPWPVYPVEPEEDKGKRAAMLVDLSTALTTFDTLGFAIDEKALTEEFGLTFLDGRPNPTRLPPAPVAPGAPGAGQPVPGKGKPPAAAPKPGKEPPKALASGAAPAGVSGFLSGQEYADRLTADGTAAAAQSLASEIEQVLMLVDSVTSLGELETKLTELYALQDPERLSELVERYMMLAELAGRHAVLEDL